MLHPGTAGCTSPPEVAQASAEAPVEENADAAKMLAVIKNQHARQGMGLRKTMSMRPGGRRVSETGSSHEEEQEDAEDDIDLLTGQKKLSERLARKYPASSQRVREGEVVLVRSKSSVSHNHRLPPIRLLNTPTDSLSTTVIPQTVKACLTRDVLAFCLDDEETVEARNAGGFKFARVPTLTNNITHNPVCLDWIYLVEVENVSASAGVETGAFRSKDGEVGSLRHHAVAFQHAASGTDAASAAARCYRMTQSSTSSSKQRRPTSQPGRRELWEILPLVGTEQTGARLVGGSHQTGSNRPQSATSRDDFLSVSALGGGGL
eukprot:2292471-Rhodomonas_salina.2